MSRRSLTHKTWSWSDFSSTKLNVSSVEALWILIRQHASKSMTASPGVESHSHDNLRIVVVPQPLWMHNLIILPQLLFPLRPPPSITQPVLHSCCSNPLRLLPALSATLILWFSPPSIVCISGANVHFLFTPAVPPPPPLRLLSPVLPPWCFPFSRSRAELLKHCGALPTRPCVHALC